MKKLTSLMLLLSLSAPIWAEAPPTPEWLEFAPYMYSNPSEMPKVPSEWSKKKKALVISSALISPIVPVLFFIQHRDKINNQVEANNYWTFRKTQFDRAVKTCNASDLQADCFMKIREMEENKNQARITNNLQVQQLKALRSISRR